MEFKDLIKARYSVREFAPTPVSDEKLNAILEAARVSPTACNNQPVRIWVVSKPEDIALIDECTPCRYGAPVVLIVGYDKNATILHDTGDGYVFPFGIQDSSIVTTHMALAAADEGLGSCWVGRFETAKILERFPIPQDIDVQALLPIGYPADTCEPSPLHTTRNALDTFVTHL